MRIKICLKIKFYCDSSKELESVKSFLSTKSFKESPRFRYKDFDKVAVMSFEDIQDFESVSRFIESDLQDFCE